jgi:hypothetical protein
MPGATLALAPIPLARAPARLLFGPLVLLAAGMVAAAGGVAVGGLPGVGLVAAGVVVDVLALYLGLVLFTLRLDVEVAMLRLSWIGGERRYVLSRGAVTRVMLRGSGAASLRPRFGAIGWAMGPAMLRRSERIELVRLARSASVILVPTDRGRLAIAPASEQQLITALSAAARVQQRLDEVATRARAVPLAPAQGVEQQVGAAPVAAIAAPAAETHVLTGIERAMLEERLAAERAAALAAAEAERQARLEAAQRAPAEPPLEAAAAIAVVVPSARRARRRAAWHRPTWLRTPALGLPRTPGGALNVARLAPFLLASVPLVGAIAVWSAAAIIGRLELPHAELRPISLAFVAAGPLAALGALVARVWFPRLLGLVVISAVAALILVGRALLG